MDDSEALVEQFLRHQGYVDFVYEPDGRIPPDFLVNKSIAIEVRRLNQNHVENNIRKGLEEVSIPLWNKVNNLINSFGPPTDGRSWFVFYRFTRPVEEWSKLKPKLYNILNNFSKNPEVTIKSYKLNGEFELDIFRANTTFPHLFVMGGHSDDESGGWLIEEIAKNLKIVIAEKTRKIAKMRSKYEFWWLALSDHIGYGLDEFDRELFREELTLSHNWDRIILIDPRDSTRWLDL
jgi:hypothetical protein